MSLHNVKSLYLALIPRQSEFGITATHFNFLRIVLFPIDNTKHTPIQAMLAC